MKKLLFLIALFLIALLTIGCAPELSQTTGPAVETAAQPTRQATYIPYPSPAVETAVQPTDLSYPPPASAADPYPAAATTAQEPETSPAADADVLMVRAVEADDGTWTFHVTVAHPDTGWEDYADGWDVVTPDGVVLKKNEDDPFTRLLLHPHEAEQPFTRSQSGISVPPEITVLNVRAHDLVDGWGGQSVAVDLTQNSGENFVVERGE